MPKFKANWAIEGYGKKSVQMGDTITASIEDVQDMVAKKYGGQVEKEEQAALTPLDVKEVPIVVPGSLVDLSTLTTDQLVAHALTYNSLTIDPSLAKEKMIAKINDARTEAAKSQS